MHQGSVVSWPRLSLRCELNHRPNVLPRERTGVQVAEDEKAAGLEGDQDDSFKMTDETLAKTRAKEEKAEAPTETLKPPPYGSPPTCCLSLRRYRDRCCPKTI
jgi:hypothetical protein